MSTKLQDQDICQKFGKALRLKRRKENMSLQDISRITGACVSNLSKIERGGAQRISLQLLTDICTALGCRLHQIMAQTEGSEIDGTSGLSERELMLITAFRAATEAERTIIELIATKPGRTSH